MPAEDKCRDTSSPTLPKECLHIIFMVCVSRSWIGEQRDVEATFLNGEELIRTLILRAPKQGLPSSDGVCDAVAPGTLFRAKRSVYGMDDAPNLWGNSHARGML